MSRSAATPTTVVVVAYDVGDDRRRQTVSDYLSQYGARVQLSVFEVELPPTKTFAALAKDLEDLISPVEDQVRLWPLTVRRASDATIILGLRRLEERMDFYII